MPPLSAKRGGRVVGRRGPNCRTRRGRRNGTKSSFPESSRPALQVTVNRRIQVQARPAARGLAASRGRRKRKEKERIAMMRRLPETARSRPRRRRRPRHAAAVGRRDGRRREQRPAAPGDRPGASGPPAANDRLCPLPRRHRTDDRRGHPRPRPRSVQTIDPAERFGIVPSTSSPPIRPVGPRTTCRDRVPPSAPGDEGGTESVTFDR
ncbi:hypothetical protein THAOC_13766, partial [Thalassiosira oceanica]